MSHSRGHHARVFWGTPALCRSTLQILLRKGGIQLFIRRALQMITMTTKCSIIWTYPDNAKQIYFHIGEKEIVDLSTGEPTVNTNGICIPTLRQIFITAQLAGYEIVLPAGLDRRTFLYALLLKYHPNLRLIWFHPKHLRFPFLLTEPINRPHAFHADRTIFIHYDYRPDLELKSGHHVLPYSMHPQMYAIPDLSRHLSRLQRTDRRIRVLFAGGQRFHQMPTELFGKLRRSDIVEHLLNSDYVRAINDRKELDALLAGEYWNGMALLSPKFRIPQAEWLELLARTDFFLCPPGKFMPMCHNIIECMAVGTIPVTNYPEWFFPRLTSTRNCVAFSTLADLDAAMARIARYNSNQIGSMREHVVSYYATHLALESVLERLMSNPQPEMHLHVLDETESSLHKMMSASKARAGMTWETQWGRPACAPSEGEPRIQR